jgi:hypothetical protein
MSGFPGHPITPPAGDFPILAGQNWDDTSLRWSYDLSGNVLIGVCVRPVPAAVDLPARPGRASATTLHPVRYRDRIGETGTENRELMEYVLPLVAVNLVGRYVGVLFSRRGSDWSVSLAHYFAAQQDDPSGTVRPGRLALVAGLPLPRWRAAVLSSSRRFCEIPV